MPFIITDFGGRNVQMRYIPYVYIFRRWAMGQAVDICRNARSVKQEIQEEFAVVFKG